MRAILTALALGMWAIAGCGYEPAAPKPAPPGTQQAKAPNTPSAPAPSKGPPQPSAPAQSGLTTNMTVAGGAAGLAPADMWNGPEGVAPARSSQPAPPPSANVEKAQAGVGKQGRDYGGGAIMAPVTVPVATYFRTRDRITFDIQIADGMRMYKATNGFAPKTHEEFMEKIIKANQIKLPDLPPGDRYIYIPAREELCVEHTQKQ
jgi:hypothetical protein